MHGWQFRFPSGAIANGFSSFNCSATMAWEVIGEKARLVGDPGCFYGGNHVRLVDGGSSNELKIDEIDQFGREMDWMADAVRGKVPLVSSGEEGLQDVRLMDAIMRSAHTGQNIAIDWTYRRAVDPAAVVDRVG
jgi:predicted dehydrogenase